MHTPAHISVHMLVHTSNHMTILHVQACAYPHVLTHGYTDVDACVYMVQGSWCCSHRCFGASASENDTATATRLSLVAERAEHFPHTATADWLLYFESDGELCFCVSTFALKDCAGGVEATEAACTGFEPPKHELLNELCWLQLLHNEYYLSTRLSPVRLDEADPAPVRGPRQLHVFVLAAFLQRLSRSVARFLVGRMRCAPSKLSTIHLQHGGGMATLPMDRSCRWEWNCVVCGVDFVRPSCDNSEAFSLSEEWVRATMEGLREQGDVCSMYATDILQGDWQTAQNAFPAAVLERLAKMKADVDPQNTFAFACPLGSQN